MKYSAKLKLKEEMAESLSKAEAVIVSEYRGLTVEEMTDLRVKLRGSKARLKVIRNRVTKKALDDLERLAPLSEDLNGPVALVFAYGDSAQATKSVLEFQKDHPNLVLKSGFMDDKKMSVDDLKAVADLPSREVLLSKIVGSIVAPHRGLVTVLSGVSRNLVQVLNAIKEKKESESS